MSYVSTLEMEAACRQRDETIAELRKKIEHMNYRMANIVAEKDREYTALASQRDTVIAQWTVRHAKLFEEFQQLEAEVQGYARENLALKRRVA